MKREYPKWLYLVGVESAVLVKNEDEHAEKKALGYAEAPQEKVQEPVKRGPGRPRKEQA